MTTQMSYYFWSLILIPIQLSSSLFPKVYLESLLSHIHFKGYDVMASIKPDTEDTLTSWFKEGNNSLFSLTVAKNNLSYSLEGIMEKSQNLEQIVVLIEFRNISHLENEMQMAKEYSRITTVPQPIYIVIAPTATEYNEIRSNKARLQQLSQEFGINSDFYIFGESDEWIKAKRVNKTLKSTPKLSSGNIQYEYLSSPEEFQGYPLPEGYAIWELYSLKNITFLQTVDLSKTAFLQKINRREDFKQAPVMTLTQESVVEEETIDDSRKKITRDYQTDQINFLATSFNFSILKKNGAGWINITSDEKLTGMGQQLLDREADIAISASEILPYRAAQLTFLHSTYYTTIWGFFKQPTSNSLRDIFINAFTLDLWLTLFATWILIILTMYALAIVKWRLGTLHENDKIVISEVFIWAAGAICQQGWHVSPTSNCLKIVFIFALITGLVSYVGYSAALVSILSVKVVPIQSLSDLVLHRYNIYQDRHTISTNDIMKHLEYRMKLLPFEDRSISSEEGLKKILTSQSAFLGVSDLFYPTARAKLCSDLQVCKDVQRVSVSKGRPVQYGMFLRKRSSFVDFFNHRVLLMYERGIRFRSMTNFFRETSVNCLDLNASEKEPLGFNDVVTAYVILLIGYLTSLTILLFEKMYATNLSHRLGGFVHFSIPS